jgi:hypothetical protein
LSLATRDVSTSTPLGGFADPDVYSQATRLALPGLGAPMLCTLPATFDRFDTNASLRPVEGTAAGAYTCMNSAQRDLFARRFSHIDTSRLRAMAEMPSAA